MKSFKIFLTYLIFSSTSSMAADYPEPIFTTSRIVELTELYILENTDINIEEYYLSNIAFNYLSIVNEEQLYSDGRWSILYECIPVNDELLLGCHLSVSVSNSENPEFKLLRGL